jgi:hypothetical protein
LALNAAGLRCAIKAGWPRPTRHASSRPPLKRIESGVNNAAAAGRDTGPLVPGQHTGRGRQGSVDIVLAALMWSLAGNLQR